MPSLDSCHPCGNRTGASSPAGAASVCPAVDRRPPRRTRVCGRDSLSWRFELRTALLEALAVQTARLALEAPPIRFAVTVEGVADRVVDGLTHSSDCPVELRSPRVILIRESRDRIEELRDCLPDDINHTAQRQRRQFEWIVGREKVDRGWDARILLVAYEGEIRSVLFRFIKSTGSRSGSPSSPGIINVWSRSSKRCCS
jgi:hypothetical protein